GGGSEGGVNLQRGNAGVDGYNRDTIRHAGGLMVTLTETAALKVRELLEQEGRSDIALRVAVQPGGCSGLRYAMYLDDATADGDMAGEQFGVRVIVDRMSAPYLSEAKIDFVDSLEAS